MLSGLRSRLLALTTGFVLLATLLIYPVLAGTFRNNWLLQRELPAHTSEPTVSAGVSLFAYVEPNELAAATSPRRRRRKATR